MPNHVTNVITAPEEVLSKITRMEEEKLIVDFELVIPMPPEVSRDAEPYHVRLAAEVTLGIARYPNLSSRNPARNPAEFSDEDFSLFIQYLQCWKKHGCFSWYDWRIKHWDTKWNAYTTGRNPGSVSFETAWSAPHPVIEALAKETKADIVHEWADEDTGSNVGWRKYSGGELIEERKLDRTNEGYELAFKLNPNHAQYYALVDGQYQCIDD